MGKIKKILIANRSEVARRIQATAHALDIKTIAIYAQQDKNLEFVHCAHEAYPLSGAGAAAYMNTDEIIGIARAVGADAVHPGYGFLSEKADFAQRVIDAGLTWIGPNPESIRLMGDKVLARDLMLAQGVPVVPGYVVHELTLDGMLKAKSLANTIGYPLIIKDPYSGGGKAMRKVAQEDDFAAAWDAVCAESSKLTGSKILLIERFIEYGRHIEVQIAGDGQSVVHLFDRECSVQRRHQKIIEEASSHFVSPDVLQKMYDAACTAAAAVGYDSIGTVEFIVTPDEHFYFLEMNTRLQVEHGVTELITGVDLVSLQLNLAETKKLSLRQQDITKTGYAIQCRLYAEDPTMNFLPSTGTISLWSLPQLPFLRIEHDLKYGQEISPFFDPMIAKFLVYGADRKEALAKMAYVLHSTIIDGIKTNKSLLEGVVQSLEFNDGLYHTQWLADNSLVKDLVASVTHKPCCADELYAVAALALALHEKTGAHQAKACSDTKRGWRRVAV